MKHLRQVCAVVLTALLFNANAFATNPLQTPDFQSLSEQGLIKANQLLVKFKPSTTETLMNSILQSMQASQIKRFYQPKNLAAANFAEIQKWRLVSFAPTQNLTNVFSNLMNNSEIEYAVPNAILKTAAVPNDLDTNLWGLNNTGQTGGTSDADIDAVEAWDTITDASSVIIAVIDSGVDYNHPDLAANMWTNSGEIAGNGIDDDNNGYIDDIYGYDFANDDADPMDDHFHGTHVAGTIAAVGDNNTGVVGVAWSAQIMALKFLDENGNGLTSDAVNAILYAVDMGADISNNSWGSFSSNQFGLAINKPLEDAIATADAAGHLFVVAAGNNGAFVDNKSSAAPAGLPNPNIISVAATDHDDVIASFSNYGNVEVDIAAPGVDILSTFPNNTYDTISGTSMAAPHVAGAAALLLAENASLTHYELKSILMNTVDPVAALAPAVSAAGRLNVANAIDFLDDSAPSCTSYDATPGAHITAGRAYGCGFFNLNACATGSDEDLGSRYSVTVITLVETSPGYFETGGACAGGLDFPPTIFMNGEAEETFLIGSSFTDAGATATDTEDGSLTAQITTSGSVDVNTEGHYIIEYNVVDSAGNAAVTAKRLIHIVATDEAPTIGLVGPACLLPAYCFPDYIEVNTPYQDKGYFGWDELDGDLTSQVTLEGSVLTDTSVIGMHEVRYEVIDSSGQVNLNKDSLFRMVMVLDAELPWIHLDRTEFTLASGTNYINHNLLLAADLKDESLLEVITTDDILRDGNGDFLVGTYTIQHSATDSDGNTTIETQTAYVVDDTTPPTVTLNGDPVVYINVGDIFYDTYITVVDDIDEFPSSLNSDNIDRFTPGTYERQYWAVDDSGNQSITLTRTVIVQEPCAEFTDTNANHVSAGRAEACGSFGLNACAIGSGDDLGFYWGTTQTTVHEDPIGSGTYHAGSCN